MLTFSPFKRYALLLIEKTHIIIDLTMAQKSPLFSAPTAALVNVPSSRRRVARRGGKLVGETWVNTSDAEDFIEAGREEFQSENYASAITLFEKALTAEGSGTKRDRTKPAELSLGEKQSAYYNLAAAHAKMENWDLAFASLELTFQSGYANGRLYGLGRAARDYEQLEFDEDLKDLKRDERWSEVMEKYRVKGSEIAFQLDPSNSSIGKAVEMMSRKKTNER